MEKAVSPRILVLLAPLWLAACASGSAAPGNEQSLTSAIEPSLRAAAASAETANDWNGAAQHWRTLLAHHPDDLPISLSLARALRISGKPDIAAELVQSLVVKHGANAQVHAELGKDYLAADRLGLALKSTQRAAELAPDDWETVTALGVVLDMLEQQPEAQSAYKKALALSPDNPQVLNNLALSQALSGDLRGAVTTMRQAGEHPSAGSQIRQNLALLLALQGDAAQAERIAAKDLPPDLLRANSQIYRRLSGQ